MRLIIRSEELELTPPARRFVARRVWFALARFGHSVQRVDVRLAALGADGGRCRVVVRLSDGEVVIVEERHETAILASAAAAERAARAVERRLGLPVRSSAEPRAVRRVMQ